MSNIFVTADWLNARLADPRVKIVDASWYLPAQNRNAKAEYLAGHIPGAVFFDIDLIADRTTDLPHMLPTPGAFAEAAGGLGLSETDTIVVYDGMGLFSAPRVWWTLRTFGAKDVKVLEGGLPAWDKAGFAKESGAAKPKPATFRPTFDPKQVQSFEGVRDALGRGVTVVDARSAPRFRGEEAEPRPGVSPGHMPGARNVHFSALADSQGRLVSRERIREIFEKAGADLSGPVITTCGSGITASIVALALAEIGKQDVAVYDGSWAEWGSRPDAPITTGPAPDTK